MEEKISIERPRPFSSGYILPFYTPAKKPCVITLQSSSVEYLKDLRRLAIYVASASELEALESFAQEMLVKKNKQWFKNTLTEEAVRAMYHRSVNADGYMMVRFSPEHLPKDIFVNDRAVTDWDAIQTQWLSKKDAVVDMISIEFVCHGIYLTKQRAELLWKIQRLYIYNSERQGILQQTNVDEHKADIEAYWENEYAHYRERVAEEIQQLQRKIRQREEKLSLLAQQLEACKTYSTQNPEWNKTMESIQHEMSQKNYFI